MASRRGGCSAFALCEREGTIPAAKAAVSISYASSSTPSPLVTAGADESDRWTSHDEILTSGPFSQGSWTMWEYALPKSLRSDSGRGKDRSHELSPLRDVSIGRRSCCVSKWALYLKMRSFTMFVVVTKAIVVVDGVRNTRSAPRLTDHGQEDEC